MLKKRETTILIHKILAITSVNILISVLTFVLLTPVLLLATDATITNDKYDRAHNKYLSGDYSEAISILEPKSHKNAGDHNLLGWSYLKAGMINNAIEHFELSVILTPDKSSPNDSFCGLGFSYLKLELYAKALENFDKNLSRDSNNIDCLQGKGLTLEMLNANEKALEIYRNILTIDKDNSFAQNKIYDNRAPKDLSLADNLLKEGKNIEAAKIYRTILEKHPKHEIALERYKKLYGYPDFSKNQLLEPAEVIKPPSLILSFRTHGDYFQVLQGNQWKNIYLKGVNIGPARPVEFPSTPPTDFQTYRDWLKLISEMNANVVRIYTILPPAFYQALKTHNENSSNKIFLFQEIWLAERDDEKDLYDKFWIDNFKNEIHKAVDLIHGTADIPYRRGHAYGIYTADISKYVIALGVGREVEPSIIVQTNNANPLKTIYHGKFVTVENANPSEVWFSEMMDYTIRYEMEKFNTQRPVTIVNWPPLDPMYHKTEATYEEELEIRRKRGENISWSSPKIVDDMDAVSLDVTKLRTTEIFPAGIFATYHVYTHWPDFLFLDPEYPKTTDQEGSNRYFGYLLDLKKHHAGMPLLIAEYGISTSWGISHLHPDGWGNGGHTENTQAKILTRMTKNIMDSKCAGGLVFAWQDEWWKRVSDLFTRAFSIAERKPMWLNLFDPEELFGIIGYRSAKTIPLLRGNADDWKLATILYDATAGKKNSLGSIKKMHAFSDAIFLYIRLDIENKEDGQKFIDFNNNQYWILLNTLPDEAGTQTIDELGVDIQTGANFLIKLSGKDSSAIYITENYNPNTWVFNDFVPGGKRKWIKPSLEISLERTSPFKEIIVEANQPRYGRDGTTFLPIFLSRSPLTYGNADISSPDYSSHSAWHFDERNGMVEIRIPWGLIYFMDPSNQIVLSGTSKTGSVSSEGTNRLEIADAVTKGITVYGKKTKGIAMAAARVKITADHKQSKLQLLDTLPENKDGIIAANLIRLYKWPKWDEVQYTSYFKKSYYALKDIFSNLEAPQ